MVFRIQRGRLFARLAGAALAAALVAGCARDDASTARYYADLELLYVLTGGMRIDTAPPDAPFTNEDLIRNFETVAFHTEFTDDDQKLVEGKTPTSLVKWSGEVTYDVFGDAASPNDLRNLETLTGRLSELTGLTFRRDTRNAKILILVANRGMRDDFVAELGRRGAGDRIQILREWSRSARFPCVGQVGESGPPGDRKLVAIIAIKGETQGLLRLSCIHEEFVQTMGLMNDDPNVRPSIFNDDQEFALMTRHDEYLLRILYDPRLRHGMTAEEGMPIVRRIVAEIGPG